MKKSLGDYLNNKKNCNGFNLLELMIAMAIASTLTIALYQVIIQTRRSVRQVTSTIDLDVPRAAFYTQVERDILGMFIPQSVKKELKKSKLKPKAVPANSNANAQNTQNSQNKNNPATNQAQNKTPSPTVKPSDQKEDQKKPEKKIEHVFSLEKKEPRIFLSFITTGGLQTVTSKGKILSQPLVRRVLYTVEPDPANKNMFKLLYSYSVDNLDLEALKTMPRAHYYELVPYIKKIEITAEVLEQQQNKNNTSAGIQDAKQDTKGEKAPPKTVAVDSWNEVAIKEKYKTAIPAYIKINGILTDALMSKEIPFEFSFKVPAYYTISPKE